MGEVSYLSPPEPLADNHDIESFASGEPSLDDWLRRRARGERRDADLHSLRRQRPRCRLLRACFWCNYSGKCSWSLQAEYARPNSGRRGGSPGRG